MLPAQIKSDIEYLLENDKVFGRSGIVMPDFSWRKHSDVFPSLVRTIIGQQLSTKAANTIWQRVVDGVGEICPEHLSRITDPELRGYGLSHQKISYLRGLLEAVTERNFQPESLRDMDDETVLQEITALKGFGVWSAQMILIFTLDRRDIWPSGDLGIREGVRMYKKLPERPDIAATDKFGQKFKEKRTAAALLLWRLKDQE